MAWWVWVLVVLLGPSALLATLLLPLFVVELVRGRPAAAHGRGAGAAEAQERPQDERERDRHKTPPADYERDDDHAAPR